MVQDRLRFAPKGEVGARDWGRRHLHPIAWTSDMSYIVCVFCLSSLCELPPFSSYHQQHSSSSLNATVVTSAVGVGEHCTVRR